MTREHLLLTVLGTNPRAARYGLGARELEAPLAPVALLELLPPEDRPNRVLAICTSQAAKDGWPRLEQALRGRYRVECVDVPDGDAQNDVNEYLKRVTDAVPDDVDLTVDVTHGYRHFSFLTYVAVLYLAALREVRVRGAYYGLLRPANPSASQQGESQSEPAPPVVAPASPFLDLRPLLELPRWLHALETLRETRSTVPLAKAASRRSIISNRRQEGLRRFDTAGGSLLVGVAARTGPSGASVSRAQHQTIEKSCSGTPTTCRRPGNWGITSPASSSPSLCRIPRPGVGGSGRWRCPKPSCNGRQASLTISGHTATSRRRSA